MHTRDFSRELGATMNTYFGLLYCVALLLSILKVPSYAIAAGERDPLQDAIAAVENEKAEMSQRLAGVRLLAKKKNAKQSIPRLGYVLQGRYDALAFEIVGAFEAFGERDALPYISDYEKRAVKEGAMIPGKLNAAIIRTKNACSRRPEKKSGD
jgi:hypothetical protein